MRSRATSVLAPIALACLLPLATSVGADSAPAQPSAAPTATAQQQGLEAGVEAVVYGLPLVIMDLTRAKSSNVEHPGSFAAPVNQFGHARSFPDASFRDVVRANVDTLYSTAWLDLAKEPLVLSVPDTAGRFYLMPMVDAWTNIFASPGKRTTGTGPGQFAITGPGWKGSLPAGVQQLSSPTNMVWLLGRTQTNGPQDYAAVHALQEQYTLVPLSSFGKPYTPPPGKVDPSIDMKAAPVDVLKAMTGTAFFNRMAHLLESNPAPAADAPVLAKLSAIGIVPGKPYDPTARGPEFAKGMEGAVQVALEKLTAASKQAGAPINGWRIPAMNLADFGTDYGTRAVVALVGLGANLAKDAVYPSAFVDGEGKPLNGANRYVIRFEPGQMPPVQAFWSITMYDADSFFVPNSLSRYAISSWMPLHKNADGSIDLYLQAQSPGEGLESNWLPAPANADFNVTLRMYWPTATAPSIIDGSWRPPAIRRVE